MMARKEPIEFRTRERCWITELLNNEAWPEVSVAQCRVEPGVTTEWHKLDVAEWYVIEQGAGSMRVGTEAPFDVSAGDTVAIPRGTPQQIRNVSSSDLIFVCVCAPRFTTDCYAPLIEHDTGDSEPT